MFIVSSDGTIVIKLEDIYSTNIHSNGLRIMTKSKVLPNRDDCVGEYSTREKCRKAFGRFIAAIMENKEVFLFPHDSDPELNTTTVSDRGFRQGKTNGKTK